MTKQQCINNYVCFLINNCYILNDNNENGHMIYWGDIRLFFIRFKSHTWGASYFLVKHLEDIFKENESTVQQFMNKWAENNYKLLNYAYYDKGAGIK